MVCKGKGGGSGSSSKDFIRSERKKAKELEEARKAGKAPPQVDEEGHDINPHIPHYIASVPWYYGSEKPTLKHQRDLNVSGKVISSIYETYIKGVPAGEAPLKYKDGACENCGSSTHKKKDCLERPRKVGAKYTSKDLKPDDYTQVTLKLDFDGKRDRWAGYDPSDYHKVVDEYERIEMTKQQLKAQKLDEDIAKGTSSSTSLKAAGFHPGDCENDDDDRYTETVNMPGQKYDSKQRATVRNLRIREDTAKYLYNLDPSSAFYDPKTRSMRENPLKETIREKSISFKGENSIRMTGEVQKVADAQSFTWSAYEKGVDVHLQADPTKAELLLRQFKSRKESLQYNQQRELLSKYGGEEHLYAPPKETLLAHTEEYVEYSRTGKVVKGQERASIKSKYIEDSYHNNHTTVWGSYWENFKWGYACCRSIVKNSYCVKMTPSDAAPAVVALLPRDTAATTSSDPHISDQNSNSKITATPKTVASVKRCRELSPSDNTRSLDEKKTKSIVTNIPQSEEEQTRDEFIADDRHRPYLFTPISFITSCVIFLD